MRNTIVALAAFLVLNAGTAFAAPINDLATGQTAIGAGTDTFYLEHKLTDSFTLGYQNVDRDNYGNIDDIYGQLRLTSKIRGIVGSRDFASGSDMYLGVAVNNALSPDADGYASLIAGSDFKEVQVGANIKLTHNVDLNVNYHSFMPDIGNDKNGVGVGATLKF